CVLLPLLHSFFFSSRRRHTRFSRDWSSDVCSSDLLLMSITRGHHGKTVFLGLHFHFQKIRTVIVKAITNRIFQLQRVRHGRRAPDRKSTRLNSSHVKISYAVFCLKKKKKQNTKQ